MVEVVLDAVLARPDDGELAGRVGSVEHARFARDAARGLDDEPALRARAACAHPVAVVGLVEDAHVVGGRRADLVAPHGVGSPRLVDGRVEDVAPAGVEEGAGGGAGNLVGELLSCREVANAQRVPLVADRVDAEQQHRAVVAHVEGAHREEVVPLGLDVGVEHELLALARLRGVVERRRRSPHCRVERVRGVDRGGGHAALQAVLLALDGAPVVPPVAVSHGDAHVGLLRARPDLLHDAVAQRVEVPHALVGVGVLGFEVGDHLGAVLLAQPLVVVEEHIAVPPG